MKRLSWILVVCLSVFLISCSNDIPNESNTQSDTTMTTETQVTPEPTASDSVELRNKALLDSIDGQIPSSYVMELSSTFQDGLSMTIKSTIMDNYSKIETSNSMMPKATVILYNPEEKIMYQYTEGDPVGMRVSDVEANMFNMFDVDAMDYSNLDLKDFENEFGANYTAKNDTYNGQEVIYIESRFSSDQASGQIRMWYSKDFYLPLKYELYLDDTLFMSSEVIIFDPTPSLKPDDFNPPKGIQFQELDMNMVQPNT